MSYVFNPFTGNLDQTVLATQFPRIRIASGFSGCQSSITQVSNGTTQLSESSRMVFQVFTQSTDLRALVLNGNFSTVPTVAPGNAFTFKATLEYNNNMIPFHWPSNTGSAMTTAAQTSGTNISFTVTTGANNATQTLNSTTNMTPGCVLYFATAAVSATIKSVTDSTHVVLWTAVNSTTNEVVTITQYQGTGTTLGDGQSMWSFPLGYQLAPAINYKWRHYRKCSSGQVMPYTGQQNSGAQFSGGNITTSDPVYGSTVQDGADYTTTVANTMAFVASSGYSWTPLAFICRQVNPVPVTMVTGDSVGFGFGSVYFQGYLGLALANASINYYNCGKSGITGINQSRYDSICQELARYVDYVQMQIGTNDINSASGNNWWFLTGQGMYLAEAQAFASGGATIFFSLVPPRTTSTGSLWNNYTGQAVLSTEPLRVQANNSFRDSTVNGMASYFANNLQGLAKYGGYNDVWTTSGMEVTSTGTAIALTATTYTFTVTSANATYLTTYTDANNQTYTVGPSISGGLVLSCTSRGGVNPPASGTLTKTGVGSGDSTIGYSAVTVSSANQQMYGEGGYWLTNGTNNKYTADGIHPNTAAIAVLAPLVNVTPCSVLPTTVYNTNQ